MKLNLGQINEIGKGERKQKRVDIIEECEREREREAKGRKGKSNRIIVN